MFRILFLIWLTFHPVHVSLTSIDYVPETKDFSVFVRMYFDDFLLDSRLSGYDIQQDKLLDHDSGSRQLLEKYLNEKLIIKVNDKVLTGELKDIDIADNEFNINYSLNSSVKPRNVTVRNLIMTKIYGDQQNMIILRVSDFEQGVKLTTDLTEQSFNVN
jgi:hypothetical protein